MSVAIEEAIPVVSLVCDPLALAAWLTDAGDTGPYKCPFSDRHRSPRDNRAKTLRYLGAK